MMGNTRTDLSAEEQTISGELTTAYAAYIDQLGLTDENGESLTLEASADGRYQAGSYYDYMKEIIEKSLNNFLADTSFPYDADAASSHGGPGGMGPGAGGMGPRDGAAPGGDEAKAGSIGASTDFTAIDQIQRKENSAGVKISGTFATAQDYIDALNADGTWVNYDATTGTATITSIADFAAAVKTASKGIAAFDQLDASQGENTLFGYGDGAGAHFDATLAGILESIESSYAADYSNDMSRVDALGHSVADRVKMYSPLYYLLASSEGYQSATVAKYFRINTGLWQGDTAVNTEANLALALENYGATVDYSFVWGQGHTMAERSGDAISNFIAWVNSCV